MKKFRKFFEGLIYSFPVQLLLNHLKRNQILLLWWLLLFFIISGSFGRYLGIPYLFLDPVYLNKVSFTSFAIMGLVIGGLSVVFHITSYILDGPRFTFIGAKAKPFATFSLNNSIIPVTFLITYLLLIIKYQVANEYSTPGQIALYCSGLIIGYITITTLFFVYIWFTNKDIFRYVVFKVDEQLKDKIRATRASAMKKLGLARKKQKRVDHYISHNLKLKKVDDDDYALYDRSAILQVFDQNHFNLVVIELVLFLVLIAIGIFKDYTIFQIPAAASVTILITLFVMFTGAFTYWFGSWSATMLLIMFLVINFAVREGILSKDYEAYGLNYNEEEVPYTLDHLNFITKNSDRSQDSLKTVEMLENWRAKFPEGENPRIIFVCSSGGGQRAALWSYNVLQHVNQLSHGKFMEQTMLMTGASGGLIGAAFHRELYLRYKEEQLENIQDGRYRELLGQDNLNAVIFSFLMNDVFSDIRSFHYNGLTYDMDRGYSFEQQLNENTSKVFDKPISDYREAEYTAQIPMMILAPTIVNDGRRLYISPHGISYMINRPDASYPGEKINGVEFLRYFQGLGSEDLRFLSALRMNATFPYITPNVTLPSNPPMAIMDAGISDNFGISDATRFIYTFRDWIAENTSGVVLVTIRDSEKNSRITAETSLSLMERITLPISSIYQNFESMQDIANDTQIRFSKSWLKVPLTRVDFEYIPSEFEKEQLSVQDSLRMENLQRASLSWRLTEREKKTLYNNLYTQKNQASFSELIDLLLP